MPKQPSSRSFLRRSLLGLLVGGFVHAGFARAEPQNLYGGRIPDEFESTGGHSLAFGKGGSAAAAELGSIRSNPAMLAMEKQYSVSAGYHWPSFGREFFQAGAMDSKTSPVAAGITYTASREKFKGRDLSLPEESKLDVVYDSPIRYRVALGMAQAYNFLTLGLGAQYVEGYELKEAEYKTVRGPTFGLGAAGLLTQDLRYGLSVENLANSRVKTLAPQTYRAGLAYALFNGFASAHVDYSQRSRVPGEVTASSKDIAPPLENMPPERMVTSSFSVRIQDMLRLLGSYGHEIGGLKRRTLAGGIALVSTNFSMSYLVSQPYLTDTKIHQALNLTLQLAL